MPKSVHSPSYNRFRALLIQARKAAALTQAEVAARLGRPQSYISKIESGERRLDLIEFLELAPILGLDAAAVIQQLQQPCADHE